MHVVLLISIVASLVFVFCLSFELRKLRGSIRPTVTGWQSLSKVVRLLIHMNRIELLISTIGC